MNGQPAVTNLRDLIVLGHSDADPVEPDEPTNPANPFAVVLSGLALSVPRGMT